VGVVVMAAVVVSVAIDVCVSIGVRLRGRHPLIQDSCHERSPTFPLFSRISPPEPAHPMELATKNSIGLEV
jgi:hypothetical protein